MPDIIRKVTGFFSQRYKDMGDGTHARVGYVGGTGGRTVATPTHTAVAVTVASGQVLAANAARKAVLIVNDSDTIIYLALGGAAALNTGIRLNASGGSFELSEGTWLYCGAIYAIHGGAGNKVLLITEGV